MNSFTTVEKSMEKSMLFISIIQITLSYKWIVSDQNRSSSDMSSDLFLKIILCPLDTMEMRLKSPDV